MISKGRFREALDKFYSQEEIYQLFNVYFLNLIAEGYIGINLGIFEVSMMDKNTNKYKFLDLLEQIFLKKDNFLGILSTFPKDIQDIFIKIAWEGKYIVNNDEKIFKEGTEFSSNIELEEKYAFFKYESEGKRNGYLYLDNDIVRWYRQFLPKNKECFVYASEKFRNLKSNSNEQEILENLSNYFKFFKDNKIELSLSGKILKSSKNNMNKYCNITEYYGEIKDLNFLKTETLSLFFYLLKDENLKSSYMRASNIKNIVLEFLDGKNIKDDNYTFIRLYINYLKGINKISKNNEEVIRSIRTIKEVLNEVPTDKIVNVENIINYIIYNDKFIDILDEKEVYEQIYINEANYERTKLSNYFDYKTYLIEPFIKSVLFILNVLGAIEIYYDLPSEKNSLYLKQGYLSKYNGIKAIKFTELGKYIFDRKDNYDFNEEEEEGESILDEERLIVTLIGDSPIKILFLEKVGIKIAENKYKITKESFLRKINNIDELELVVGEFKKKIGKSENDVWIKFFKELEGRMKSIKLVNNYKVIKLEKDNELISFITKNEKISKLILKAENFHIIVADENIEEFVKILRENGYYLS